MSFIASLVVVVVAVGLTAVVCGIAYSVWKFAALLYECWCLSRFWRQQKRINTQLLHQMPLRAKFDSEGGCTIVYGEPRGEVELPAWLLEDKPAGTD